MYTSAQNAAAHLVLGARRYDRITLKQLHWLPVQRLVVFKTVLSPLSTYNCSAYLAADCQLVPDQLHSATSRTEAYVVRRTYSNYGDRCFAAAGQKNGTAFQLICDKLTLTFNDLNCYSRHFGSGAEILVHCD